MTDLFAGGEMDVGTPSSGSVYEVTTSGAFDSASARCGIYISTSSSYWECATFTGSSDVFFHWRSYLYATYGATPTPLLTVYAGATPVARLQSVFISVPASYTITAEYYSGGVWTAAGASSFTLTCLQLQTLDMRVNVAGGAIEVYSSGTKLINVSGLTLAGSITMGRWSGPFTAQQVISEVVAATTSTVGVSVKTRYPSGAGNSSSWTGTYADVDEIVYSDADGLSSAASNQVSLFTHSGATLTGLTVRGVCVASRGKKGATGPTGVQSALRISAVNYFTATMNLTTGYLAYPGIWTVSPATAVAFTATEVTNAEFGLKSI